MDLDTNRRPAFQSITYRAPKLRIRDLLFLLLPGIFVAGLSLFVGLLCAFYAYVNYGPVAASRWSIPWFWLSFVILILWSVLSLVRLLPRTRTISVYPRGIYLSGFWGTALYQREPLDIPWEQMAGISIEFSTWGSKDQAKTCQRAVLFRKQGRPIRLEQAKNSLNGFENLPEMSSQIKAHLYARLAPAYLSQYKNGQVLTFGPISIHCDYLILSGLPGNIAWSRVRQINIRSGYLVVELDGPDSKTMIKRFPISRVPNLELLLDLIEHHTVYM